jgi:hypothetical protein
MRDWQRIIRRLNRDGGMPRFARSDLGDRPLALCKWSEPASSISLEQPRFAFAFAIDTLRFAINRGLLSQPRCRIAAQVVAA